MTMSRAQMNVIRLMAAYELLADALAAVRADWPGVDARGIDHDRRAALAAVETCRLLLETLR
jgi:hypothetical protein